MGPRKNRTDIDLNDDRCITAGDFACLDQFLNDTLYNGRLADARFANEARIITSSLV